MRNFRMQIDYHRTFSKYFAKQQRGVRKKFSERRDLFAQDEFHPLLHNHKLNGKYAGCRSINITGDVRAIFYIEDGIVIFTKIGTHAELYEE